MKLLKKLVCAVCALALVLGCAFTLAGCKVNEEYKKVYEDGVFVGWELNYSGYKNKLTGDIKIPDEHIEGDLKGPVIKIGDQAFSNSKITSVFIPETVKEIGIAAFAFNIRLSKVTFEEGIQLDEISQAAFAYCEALTEINLPQGIKTIGFFAFLNCSKLQSIVIPEGVTIVRISAFEYCTSLESVTLPESLVTIGNQAFYNTALREVVIPAAVEDKFVEHTTEDGEDDSYTLYGIGYGAFHTCAQLEKVTVNGRIKTIPSGAFGYCPKLTQIFLPSTLKEVQGALFTGSNMNYAHAFHSGNSSLEIYFEGSSADWLTVDIDDSTVKYNGVTYTNGSVLNVAVSAIHYNATGLPNE